MTILLLLLVVGFAHFSFATTHEDLVAEHEFLSSSVEKWTELFELVTNDMNNWIGKNSIIPDKINVVRPYFNDYWGNHPNEILNILLVYFTKEGWSVNFVDEPFNETYVDGYLDDVNFSFCLYRNTELENSTKYHLITPNGDDVKDYHFVSKSMDDYAVADHPGKMITKYNMGTDADPDRCNETMNRKLLFITQIPDSYREKYQKEKQAKRKSCKLDELCGHDHDALQRSSNIFIQQYLSQFIRNTLVSVLILLDETVIPSDLTLDHIEDSIDYIRCHGLTNLRFIRSVPIEGGFSGLVTGAGVMCHVVNIENQTIRRLNNIPDDHIILSRSNRGNVMLENIKHGDDGYFLTKGISYEYPYKSGESYLEKKSGRCFSKNVSFILFPV